MKKYTGKRVYEGIAIGKIIKYDESININDTIGKGYNIELERFNNAREKAKENYEIIYNKSKKELLNNNSDIILSYISLLDDLDLIENVDYFLKNENISAEKAVDKTCHLLKEMLSNIENEYLKERVNDIQEVCTKIINYLLNKKNQIINYKCIVVSNNLSVSTLLQIDKTKLLGLVLENVSPNSHIAILARSLGIPCIASLNESLVIEDNSEVILDCSNGVLITSPSNEEIKKYKEIQAQFIKNKQELLIYKNIEIKTIDNKKLKVYANISSSFEIDSVKENGADGIGLFRSEYIYINNDTFPSEDQQFNHYVKCVQEMKDKPTIIRTMDIGADKQVEYFNLTKENNPFLGYRCVRLYKQYKEIFITQLLALLRASNYGNLKIMIPMITNIEEVKYILTCLEEAKETLRLRKGQFNKNMKIGVMIETPAAALICDEIAKYVDFFSIGTNDLSQYILAIDRENSNVLDVFNPSHKAILRLIYHISKVAKENNIEVGICGELARSKELQGFFILCGIDEISVSSSYVLECKKNIAEIDTRKLNLKDYIN